MTNYLMKLKRLYLQNPMFKGKSYATLNQSLKDVNALATYIERQNPFKDLGQTATKGAAGTGLTNRRGCCRCNWILEILYSY
jgi:hypothetical protein